MRDPTDLTGRMFTAIELGDIADVKQCAFDMHGVFMCDESIEAGTVDVPRTELVAMGREHPSNFSDERLALVCGRESPT